jgi:polar amino acid transport system substrate-binding protein
MTVKAAPKSLLQILYGGKIVLTPMMTTLVKGALCGTVAVFLAAAGTADFVKAGELELIEDNTLIVAFNGDMPGTGWQDGRLIGLDGELMNMVATNLGLKVKPALMEWAGEIASLKARRVDIMHGMMGWNDQRIKVISISDPIYYGGANITQRKSTNWQSITELEGRTIATIQGFGWIDQLKAIEGSELKLYDTSDAAIRDLLAGRIEALFADPPLIQYALSKNPDWDIHALPVTQEFDEKYSLLTGKYNVVFGLSQEAPDLLEAVNAEIAKIWASCANYEVAKKYGLGEKSWFDPGSLNLRAGIDRPADWKQPTLPDSCG